MRPKKGSDDKKTTGMCYLWLVKRAALAEETQEAEVPSTILETLLVSVVSSPDSGFVFNDSKKASDISVGRDKLKHRSVTLGNALADELGVHSNPFGSGAWSRLRACQDFTKWHRCY